MPRKELILMPKSKAFHANLGTVWFLAILLISLVGAYIALDQFLTIMILAIAGAIVAILNITKSEEDEYLLGITALVIISSVFINSIGVPAVLEKFLLYLIVGFGVTGFILAISTIAKVGLKR